MKQTLRNCIFFGCVVGLTMLPLSAQENSYSFFTAGVGAGFTEPLYSGSNNFDLGWNFQGQAGVNFFGGHLGLVGEFDFQNMGVDSAVLGALGYPGGVGRIYSFSGEPILRLNPHSRTTFYLIGGPGIYHGAVDFTAPATNFVGVTVPVVLASYSTNNLGVTGGAGVDFHLGRYHASKFFAEARYTQMYSAGYGAAFAPFSSRRFAYLPVTFGFRW